MHSSDIISERLVLKKLLNNYKVNHTDSFGFPDYLEEDPEGQVMMFEFMYKELQKISNSDELTPFQFLLLWIDRMNEDVYYNQQRIKAYKYDKNNCIYLTFAPVIDLYPPRMIYCYAVKCVVEDDEVDYIIYDPIEASKTGLIKANCKENNFGLLARCPESINICQNYLLNSRLKVYDFFKENSEQRFMGFLKKNTIKWNNEKI